MSSNYQNSKWHELQQDLISIREIPERVSQLSIVRQKELILHIRDRVDTIIGTIYRRLDSAPHENFEHAASNTYQVFNYYELKNLESLIEKSIQDLTIYDSEVFDSARSQQFFEFMFQKFIFKSKYPKTEVTFIFRQLFDKTRTPEYHIDTNYKIICTRLEFAIFYNEFIVGSVSEKSIQDFEISINNNEPTLKELYLIKKIDKRKDNFNSILSDFELNLKK